MVIEDTDQSRIIGTITVLIEQKLIHNFGLVCHIEDVVVDAQYRKQGLGETLIKEAIQIADTHKCYKTILDCSESNIEFYTKCGFLKKEICMRHA